MRDWLRPLTAIADPALCLCRLSRVRRTSHISSPLRSSGKSSAAQGRGGHCGMCSSTVRRHSCMFCTTWAERVRSQPRGMVDHGRPEYMQYLRSAAYGVHGGLEQQLRGRDRPAELVVEGHLRIDAVSGAAGHGKEPKNKSDGYAPP